MLRVLGFAVAVCCGWAGPTVAGILVVDGYVRAMPPGVPNTAAFMTLKNTGDTAVTIDGGRSDVAERVEIHSHVHSDGMMRMRQVPAIVIPAGGEFVLKPGAHHLMLMTLRKPPAADAMVHVVLSSGADDVVDAKLPVRSVHDEHRHH